MAPSEWNSVINFGILNQIGSHIGVQEHWNLLEGAVVGIVDAVAPLVEFDLGKIHLNDVH